MPGFEDQINDPNIPIEELLARWAMQTNQRHEDELREKMRQAEAARQAESAPAPASTAPDPPVSPDVFSQLFSWMTD